MDASFATDLAAARLALAGGVLLLLFALFVARRPARVSDHPQRVLAGLALPSVAALVALVSLDPLGLRLVLNPSTEPLLPRDDPARAAYERATREFGDDEIYVIALVTEDVFAEASLAALTSVHREIARLPEVEDVTSLADVVSFHFDAEHGWIDVGRLFDEPPTSDAARAALRSRALEDPLLRGSVVSADGRAAGLAVRFRSLDDRTLIESRLDARIEALLRTAESPGLRFHVAGRPHAKTHVYHGMLRDLRLLVPLAFLVIATLLALAKGSRRGVLLPLATVGVATLWTFGALAALGRPLTILSVLLAPVLIAIGSVYGVHVLARYDEESRAEGPPHELARRTLAHVRLPVAIAGLTTQAGFAALALSDVPAVIELGGFAVLGVGGIALLALLGLPAWLALLPPRRGVETLPGPLARASLRFDSGLARLLARSAEGAVRRPTAVIASAAVAAATAGALLPRIVVDTDYLSYFAEDSRVRRDFEAVSSHLAGAIPLYAVIDSGSPGGFREPRALEALAALERRVTALPAVGHTRSVADLLPRLNRAIERDAPEAERIPASRAGVTELLQFAPKDELGGLLTADHTRANLRVRTGAVGSAAVRDLALAIRAAAANTLPADLPLEVSGNALLLARSADGIARSQPRAIGLAALVIFVLVASALGSLRLGLLAMVPNLLPVLLYFGLLGLGAAPLSLPTSLIGAMALGIAVDDTAHLLVRYRRERSAGASPEQAVHTAVSRVGRPVAVTSLVLAAGFAVVALSSFVPLREFGWLSALTMLLCLVTDLLLLPALLVRTRA